MFKMRRPLTLLVLAMVTALAGCGPGLSGSIPVNLAAIGGGTLAFTSYPNIYALTLPDGQGGGLRASQLTSSTQAPHSFPRWSPDGLLIAYHAMPNLDGNWDIFTMKPDGSGTQRLTQSPGEDLQPAWSPDGQRLVFSSGPAQARQSIYVMEADGSNARLLIESGNAPVWSPSGGLIAYCDTSGGDNEICVIDADGGNKRLLTNNDTGEWEPCWSPDGEWIVYVSGTLERNDLYAVRADGSVTYRLTNDSGPNWTPDWRP
jgi:Tol biopolymer transport system component